MTVSWHGVRSSERSLSGGGPQGSTIGLLEYLSQSNNNTENIDPELKYKWLDDLSVLEIVNLLTVGISSYNLKAHVPSDILTSNGFIQAEHLTTQETIDAIETWTFNNQMKLNQKKSCGMIFNFTQNYQFTSRLTIGGERLEFKDHTKILGLILEKNLKWSKNTEYLVKKANARMEILRRLSSFSPPIKDMLTVYISFIRSILEQSCVIWHSTLTLEDSEKLERVQKNAFRNILKERYENYENALVYLKMDTLSERRKNLIYSFGKKCLKLEQTKHLFPLKERNHQIQQRYTEKYEVLHANTDRLKNSTVPYIQRLLNEEERKKST
jgi:hypothetical protein